ncbi:MAG: hypothetical protein WCD81_06635 [Candidatus Bathyarchaeia archaeon]
MPYGEGTYDVTAMFSGDNYDCPCQTSIVANASAVPLRILFSVTPDNFENGTTVLLNATIIDPSTGAPFTSQSVNVNFYNVDSNGVQQKLGTNSTAGGMAFWSTTYTSNGTAYAYKADINADSVSGVLRQGIASSPVQLTVGNPTVLLLNVSRANSSTNHTIESQLLSDGTGVSNETVTITVNGQSFQNKTDQNGYFNLTIDLEPECHNGTTAYQNVTYTITASFAGDVPTNATAYDNALDGTNYTACTTVQYVYEPSTNSTILTVTPQSTLTALLTETPQEMQKQAEQNGTLKVKNQWSWWYPWYRVHYQFIPNGTVEYDYGVSPLPFGNTLAYTKYMNNTVVNFVLNANLAILSAITLSEYQGYIISMLGPAGFLGALIISLTTKLGALAANWNSVGGLESILAGSAVSMGVGLLKNLGSIIEIVSETMGMAEVGFGTLYCLLSVPINIAFWIVIFDRLSQLGAGVRF